MNTFAATFFKVASVGLSLSLWAYHQPGSLKQPAAGGVMFLADTDY